MCYLTWILKKNTCFLHNFWKHYALLVTVADVIDRYNRQLIMILLPSFLTECLGPLADISLLCPQWILGTNIEFKQV